LPRYYLALNRHRLGDRASSAHVKRTCNREPAHITQEKDDMIDTRHPAFLRTVLFADAATCVATGLLMTAGAGLLAGLTHIPENLLMAAGLSLFPVAAFIAFIAMRPGTWPVGVWLVIAGNIGWVVGSLYLLVPGVLAPNTLGYAFLIVQALAVVVLTELEITGVRHATLPA
jgi:hypothetical protein